LNCVAGVLYIGARWCFLLSDILHNSQLFGGTKLVRRDCLDGPDLSWHLLNWVIWQLLGFSCVFTALLCGSFPHYWHIAGKHLLRWQL